MKLTTWLRTLIRRPRAEEQIGKNLLRLKAAQKAQERTPEAPAPSPLTPSPEAIQRARSAALTRMEARPLTEAVTTTVYTREGLLRMVGLGDADASEDRR